MNYLPRVAVVGNTPGHASIIAENLMRYDLKPVYEGASMLAVDEIRGSQPNVILVASEREFTMGNMERFFASLRRADAPWIKVVVKTDREEDTPFVQLCLESGASVVGVNKSWRQVALAIEQTKEGKQITACETSTVRLDHGFPPTLNKMSRR